MWRLPWTSISQPISTRPRQTERRLVDVGIPHVLPRPGELELVAVGAGMVLVVDAHDGGVLIALARLLQQAHGPAPVEDLERQLDLREREGER